MYGTFCVAKLSFQSEQLNKALQSAWVANFPAQWQVGLNELLSDPLQSLEGAEDPVLQHLGVCQRQSAAEMTGRRTGEDVLP